MSRGRIIWVLLGSLLLSGCGFSARRQAEQEERQRQQADSAHREYEAMIRDFLVGKRVASLTEVMAPDRVPEGAGVLLVYHGLDCGSCMDAGFGTLQTLKRDGVPCIVVAVEANSAEAQQRYGYREYIYSDPGDRLRRELKYVSTPLLLLLNDSLQITDIYKPAAGTESAAERFRTTAVRTRQSR